MVLKATPKQLPPLTPARLLPLTPAMLRRVLPVVHARCSRRQPTRTSVRLHVIDVDAGIAVGFTLFYGIVVGGPYIDFHMLKVRNGQVVAVHAVLAAGEDSGWE